MSRLLKQFSRRMVSTKKAKENEHQSRLSASATDEQPLEIFQTLPEDASSTKHSTPTSKVALAQSSTQENAANEDEQQEDDLTNCRVLTQLKYSTPDTRIPLPSVFVLG